MQVDMHYYGTYTLARAAGLSQQTARVIATSSQFVDDNVEADSLLFSDGGQMRTNASGHHWQQLENLSSEDQRDVWVPFHFLPGAEGESFTERLLCTKNSSTVREMLKNHLELVHKPYAPFLIGIAAHVLADTFSHYNFSGVSSRRNQVDQPTIKIIEPEYHLTSLDEERLRFFERFSYILPNIKAHFAEELSGALGHGGVSSYPDLPYLTWSYKTEGEAPKTIRRCNFEDYMEAAESLYTYFLQFAEERPDLCDTAAVPFESFIDSVAIVLSTPGDKHQRSGLWQVAMTQGVFLGGRNEEIPPYAGDMWKSRQQELASCPDCALINEMDIYKFHQAAEVHRTYVQRELLPAHDILVC